MTKATLAIVGKGAFGSGLHALYTKAGLSPDHFGRDGPLTLRHDYVLLAVPTSALDVVLNRVRFASDTVPVLCCKGLLPDGAVPSSLLSNAHSFAVLSGPGFADELAKGLPTVHSLGVSDASMGPKAAQDLSTSTFRLYWSDDPTGIQVCGALKNILAIATGIAWGLDLGENARASLLVRGIKELSDGLALLGGDAETVTSPAGLGDVLLTCSSPKSRNFRFGLEIAGGAAPKEAHAALGTVEGLAALEGFLAVVPREQAPIASTLHDILHGGLGPNDAVARLMHRPLARE